MLKVLLKLLLNLKKKPGHPTKKVTIETMKKPRIRAQYIPPKKINACKREQQ